MGAGPFVVAADYDDGMGKWIWSAAAIAVVAFIGIVVIANDSASVRVGAWAQFVATLGTVFAAFLAYRTAEANRRQAKEASQGLAEATRPQLSLKVTPFTFGSKQGDSKAPLRLTVTNKSKYDVKDCRVEWGMDGSPYSRQDLGPIFADPKPPSAWFSDPVTYAGGMRSQAGCDLGLHEKFTPSTFRVVIRYSSTFSGGEWMEVHYWMTEDTHYNADDQNWGITHTYDPPKWIPTGT